MLGLALVVAGTLAAATPANDAEAKARFDALLEEAWEFAKRERPLFATATGDHRYNDRLPSVAPPDLERRAAASLAQLATLQSIDRAALSPQDRVSYDVFEREQRRDLAGHQFRAVRIPITSDSGFHPGISQLAQNVPLATTKDYENYIARLRAIPAYFQQFMGHMRDGLRTGFTSPRIALEGYESTMQPHVVDSPDKSVFWKPFAAFPHGVPVTEHERLRAAGRDAIATAVIPAYRDLLEFFTQEYRQGARATLGASELPDGKAYYAWLVKDFTTLDTTPKAVHAIGVREVERIRREMDSVVRKVGFQGTFAAFLEFLRTDPRFYAKTPDELLRQASWIAKRMDGKLPSLFGRLPRQPYSVEPVPDDLAPNYTGGRYFGAARRSRPTDRRVHRTPPST
jgi:uncharacterized protein (DUF885 family)